MAIAHREPVEVEVCGGAAKIKIRPWTMAMRAEMKPKLVAVFDRLGKSEANGTVVSLASLLLSAENELAEIAEATAELPKGLDWNDLWWEDLPPIVQAIWETSIFTPAGGGLGGKAMALAGGVGRSVVVRAKALDAVAKREQSQMDSSRPKSEREPS